MMVSNRNLLFQGLIFRFHVNLQGCTQIIVESTQKLPLCTRKKQVAMARISGHQSWTWDSTTKIQGEKRIPETKIGSFYQGWKIWKMSGVFFLQIYKLFVRREREGGQKETIMSSWNRFRFSFYSYGPPPPNCEPLVNFQLAMLDDLKVNDPRNSRRTEILEKKQGFRGASQGALVTWWDSGKWLSRRQVYIWWCHEIRWYTVYLE